MPCVNYNPSKKDSEPFVEIDPTRRYGRFQDLLGEGSTKKVYRAFDQQEGKEVAWNQIFLRKFIDNEEMITNLYFEAELLRTLKNKNILTSFGEWFDRERSTLYFITEVSTSGNLRDYRKKHRHVSIKAVKKWLRQILKGLEYLHMHEPCIIHRDLNCSNVFINGNTGHVKIGDLGYATAVGKTHVAHSVVGTPEFMAPEVFEENYTEAADIYAFGMCVLELMTLEIPYSECDGFFKIYKKVMSGVRPKAMNKVRDPEVKRFIEKCLAKQLERPSASELLKDPLFDGLNDDDDDDEIIKTRLRLLFDDLVHC